MPNSKAIDRHSLRRRRHGGRAALAAGLALLIGAASPAEAQQPAKLSYGANWLAEAEHGGFYQAEADGTYAKYGLDVTIVQGGPNVNGRLLMSSGRIDCFMGSDMLNAMDAVAQGLPTIAVAGMFQKDPQVLISHPGEGLDTFESLKSAHVIYVARSSLGSFYQWLESRWGFSADNVAPYNFNAAPFLADKKSIQQGYATSEPFAIEKQGGFKPNVFLLADYGFDTASTTIECRRDFVQSRPDVVQRFVDATAIGWYHYLYGDNGGANELIKRDNPEMTDEQIAYTIAKLKEYGIVDSGEALTHGIGAMSDERMKSFYDQMAKAGVLPQGLDYKKAYTLQFVNKGVGLDLRPK
jgi:NitT/TauT family transport system substrate-binding protein